MCFECLRIKFQWKKKIKIFTFAYSQGRGGWPPLRFFCDASPWGRRKKRGYFTVRQTASFYPPAALCEFFWCVFFLLRLWSYVLWIRFHTREKSFSSNYQNFQFFPKFDQYSGQFLTLPLFPSSQVTVTFPKTPPITSSSIEAISATVFGTLNQFWSPVFMKV